MKLFGSLSERKILFHSDFRSQMKFCCRMRLCLWSTIGTPLLPHEVAAHKSDRETEDGQCYSAAGELILKHSSLKHAWVMSWSQDVQTNSPCTSDKHRSQLSDRLPSSHRVDTEDFQRFSDDDVRICGRNFCKWSLIPNKKEWKVTASEFYPPKAKSPTGKERRSCFRRTVRVCVSLLSVWHHLLFLCLLYPVLLHPHLHWLPWTLNALEKYIWKRLFVILEDTLIMKPHSRNDTKTVESGKALHPVDPRITSGIPFSQTERRTACG